MRTFCAAVSFVKGGSGGFVSIVGSLVAVATCVSQLGGHVSVEQTHCRDHRHCHVLRHSVIRCGCAAMDGQSFLAGTSVPSQTQQNQRKDCPSIAAHPHL